MTTIKAIDISYCQPKVNYRALKIDGIDAVIIRNGYLNHTDDMWDTHVSGALKAGIDVGTYTYIVSETPEQARKEASETIKRLEKYKGSITYPVFADMESSKYLTSLYNKTSRTKILLAFLEVIEKAGYYPAVYINPSWLETYIDKTKILGRYDIWLAAWTDNPNKQTKYQYGQTMWQWGLGAVDGITDKVDCDLVYCNYPQKIKSAGKNFLPQEKTVILNYDAAIRYRPSIDSKKIGVLTAGTKCVILKGAEMIDKASGYTYVKLAGGKEQWIVKSAIRQ